MSMQTIICYTQVFDCTIEVDAEDHELRHGNSEVVSSKELKSTGGLSIIRGILERKSLLLNKIIKFLGRRLVCFLSMLEGFPPLVLISIVLCFITKFL